MAIETRIFGTLSDGREAHLFRLTDESGQYAEITDLGATVVTLCVRDKDGALRDVALGYDTLAEYEADDSYIGALCGRVANKISGARYTYGGHEYILSENAPGMTLHGGADGFKFKLWNAEIKGDTLVLSVSSPDGESGFPGNVDVSASFCMKDGALHLLVHASTDKDTPLNIVNHSYFNLNGEGQGDVLRHILCVDAAEFCPVAEGNIISGTVRSVDGTPFDFRAPHAIGERISKTDEQFVLANGGYDHAFVIKGEGPRLAAHIVSPDSGIAMSVITDLPCVHLYTSNHFAAVHGKNGNIYDPCSAFCLEAERYPDAMSYPNYPSAIVKAGEQFTSTLIYKFDVSSLEV